MFRGSTCVYSMTPVVLEGGEEGSKTGRRRTFTESKWVALVSSDPVPPHPLFPPARLGTTPRDTAQHHPSVPRPTPPASRPIHPPPPPPSLASTFRLASLDPPGAPRPPAPRRATPTHALTPLKHALSATLRPARPVPHERCLCSNVAPCPSSPCPRSPASPARQRSSSSKLRARSS